MRVNKFIKDCINVQFLGANSFFVRSAMYLLPINPLTRSIRKRGEGVLLGTIIFNRVVNTLTMISDTTKERREFYCKLLKQQY